MWIRSQSKEDLIKCNNLTYAERYIYPNKNRCCIYGNGVFLGIYSTKEKALKVLDMIHERICGIEGMRLKAIMLNGDNRHIFITEGYVFQMPQDSEV